MQPYGYLPYLYLLRHILQNYRPWAFNFYVSPVLHNEVHFSVLLGQYALTFPHIGHI